MIEAEEIKPKIELDGKTVEPIEEGHKHPLQNRYVFFTILKLALSNYEIDS